MAPATKSVITFIPFPSTVSQKLTSHQQQQQQSKSMSNKEQTVSILHKQNPSDCAVKVRKQVFIQQQSLLKKTNIIKKTINQPVFSSNQQSFDGRDVKSVFVKTGINKPVCNKVELNNQVFNKRSINKTDTCKRVNEESMRRGHYIVSQSQKFTTISRQPTYQCSNLMSDQNKMTSVSSSQETKGHVIHRPVAVRPEIKRIQPLSGSVHGRILTPPALVRADVVRTSTATTAPALPSVHVVKTKPYDSSKVNVSLSRGFPSSAKHIIMTARELPSSSVNTVNKCGSSPSTNNTMRNPHVLAVSSSRFGCNVASSCIVMNSNTSTEQAGCGRNKPVVTSCVSANHLPCSSSTNNSNYSKLYAMLCAKDISNYENVCNINSSVQVKQSVASSQVNENMSCIPATAINNVLDTAAIGSDGTDNTVETGSDEVYNTVETGSDELYNTVETGSDGVYNTVETGSDELYNTVETGSDRIDNTVETGSDEVYDTLETGSDEVYNTVEIGSKGVDNMEMVGSDRTDDIFEIESNEVDIAGEIRSDRVDDTSEIGSNGVANTVVIESSGTDTKVEIGSDGTDKTVETGSDGTNKTVEIGSDGVCSTVMTESNDQHSETPSSKAAECLEMNILVSNSLKVETQNTGFGTSSTSLKSQKVESSEVKPRVKVTHKLTCNQCKCTFQTHLAYHTHINSHLKNDPVKKTQYKTQTVCNICGKIFKRAFLLKSHIYSHTGEKPYLCSYCKRAFSDPSNCRAHVKTHTDKKKIFSCISCKKSFTQRRYLHKHMTDICHVPVPKWRYDFKKSTKENSSDFPAHKKIIVQFSKNKDESECSSKENELESEASKNKLYEAERDCSEKENVENVKSVDLISLKSSLCIDPKKIPYVSCVRLEEDKNGLFWKSKKQDVSESSDLKHRSDKLEKNAVVKCMRLDEEYPYLRPLFKEMLTNTKAFLTLRPSAKDPRRNVYQLCVAEPAENIEDDEAVQTAKLAAAKAWQSRLVDGDFTTDDEDVDDMQYVSEDDYKSSEDEIIRPHKRKRISSSSDETAFTSDDDFKPNLGIFHWSRTKRKRRRKNTKHKRFKHIHRTTGIEECDSAGSSEISQTSWARYTKRKYKKKTKDLEKEITVKRARGRPKKEKDNSESVNKKEEKLTVKNDAENKNAEPNEQKNNTEKERFNCVECNLRFMQQTNLVLHIVTNHLQNSSFFQRSHFGSEQFVCKYCEKACYSFRDFIHHIPVHATEILEKMTQYVVAKHKFSKKNCRRIRKENNITKPADSSSQSFSESVPLKSEQKNSNTPFMSSDKRAEETKPAVSSTATPSVHTVLNPSSALSTHKSNSSRNIIVVSKVKDGSYKINNQSELGVRNTTTQNKPGHHGNNAALDGKQFNNMPSAGGEKIAINYQGEKVTEQNMQIRHSGQLQINPPCVADNASSASYPGNRTYNKNMAQYSNPSMTLNQANRSSGNQVNQISKRNINYINQSFPAVEVKPTGSKSSSSFMDSFMSYVQKQEAKQSQMRVTDMKHNRYVRNVSTGFAVNDREHRIWNSGCSENNPKQNQTSSSCPKLSNMSPVSTGTVSKIIVTKRSESTSAPHPSDVKTSLPSFGNFRSKPVEQYKQNYIPRNETVVTEGNRRYVTFEVKCPFSNEDKHVNQKYKNYVSRKPQSYGVQQYQPSVQQGVSKEHQYFLTKEKNYSEVHPTDSYQHHVTKHYQHYLNEEHQPHAARENTYFVTGTHVTAENNQNVHKQHQHYVTKQSQHHVTEDNKHHTDTSYQHFTEVKKFPASEVNKQCVSEVNKHCVTQECKTFPSNKSNPADEKSCNSTTVGQISFSNCSHSVDDRDGSDIIVFGSDSVMSGSEEQTLDKLTQLRVFRNKNLPVTHKTPEVSETENNRPLHDEDESPMNTFVDGVEESLLDSDSVLNTMLNLGNNSSSNNVSPVKQSKAQQVTVTETNEHQNISPSSLTGCYEMSTVKTNYKDTDSVDGRLECKNTQDIIQVEEKKKTSDIKLSNISLPDSGRKEMSEESGSSEQCIVPSSKASEISVKSDMCSLMKINDNIQHRPFDTRIDLQKEMDVCSENFSVTVVPDSRGAVCESNSFCESSKVTDSSYKDMKKKKDNESMMMILPEVNEMIPQDVCEMLQMGEIQDNHVISMQNVSESSENTSAPMQDTDAASPVTMECEATLETAPVMSDIVPTLMENISEKEGKDDVTISCEGTLKPIVLNIALTECNSTQPLLIKKQPGQLTLTTSSDLIETLSSTDNSEVKVRKDVNIRNNTDVTTTDSTNVTATGNTDATATGNRDVTAADSTDVTNADSTDVTATDSTDNTATDVTTIDSTCTPVPNKRYVTGTDSKNLICTENIVTMDTNNSLNTKKHNLISQKLKKSKNTKNICCQKMSSRKYLSVKKTVKKKQTFSPVSSSFTSHRVPLCMSKKKKVKTAPKCSKKLDTDVVTSDSNTCFVPS